MATCVNVLPPFASFVLQEKNFSFFKKQETLQEHPTVKGFTMIELLAVIAVILLLAVICIPGYRHCLIRAKVVAGKPLSKSEQLYVIKHYPDLAVTFGISIKEDQEE